MIKVVVFDLGGTLMEYKGMPLDWSEYYNQGFLQVNKINDLNLSDAQLSKSVEILKSYNPRITGRQKEISPEVIFDAATSEWSNKPPVEKIITDFFCGLKLEAKIYDYSRLLLQKCRDEGFHTACLTDLPNGMPDSLFRKSISEIENLFDLYVSSQTCGFRKPCKEGLQFIADSFNVKDSELLFVGDEKKDEETARNAGCCFEYINDYLKTKIIGITLEDLTFENCNRAYGNHNSKSLQ